MLKCSLAYLIGCMATFIPQLSDFLGKQDGKHMVATITVYFNPARSAGSMIEALMLGLAAFLYATFIAISSMAVSVLFDTQFDMLELGHVVVLVVFCAGGLGLVGWVKQWWGTPLTSVACSLASLAIITVLTKENAIQTGVFSDDKITQVLKMVLMGMVATTFVCLTVWPVSARKELRNTMIETTDGFSDMLTTITRGFLDGCESDMQTEGFLAASARYKSLFASLSKNLGEAKMEHYFLGHEEEYKLEATLVECMRRLAQAIGGLRSAAATQFTLLKELSGNGSSTPVNRKSSETQLHSSFSSIMKSRQAQFAVLAAIDEAPDESSEAEDLQEHQHHDEGERWDAEGGPGLPTIHTPADIFARFVTYLGPSMKSLAYTLSEMLQELPFGQGPDFKITINKQFASSLTEALMLYSGARGEALKELYKSKELRKDRAESIEADFEEVAASCGHFSFCLQDFAEEMHTYLVILGDLKDHMDSPKQRSWNWLAFWRTTNLKKHKVSARNADLETESSLAQSTAVEVPKFDLPEPELRPHRMKHNMRGMPTTTRQTFYTYVLKVVRFLQKDDIRFATKVGIGAALWAMIAFIPITRPFYQHWRGEWGLLSYMLVCNMTIGASNTTGFMRFLGTLIGAIIGTWSFSHNFDLVLGVSLLFLRQT